MPQMIEYRPQSALPLWARLSLERLQCDVGLRNGPQLNYLLDVYARLHGEQVDVQTRNHMHLLCRSEFPEFDRRPR
jgi:hypothetical protein